ncbi:hypothetical protein EMIT0P100_10618 [Pseudomonas sp. IT-P100]
MVNGKPDHAPRHEANKDRYQAQAQTAQRSFNKKFLSTIHKLPATESKSNTNTPLQRITPASEAGVCLEITYDHHRTGHPLPRCQVPACAVGTATFPTTHVLRRVIRRLSRRADEKASIVC